MARNNLNFVIALKFLTENFNRQATKVKSQLLTLQRNFLSLASAVGVGSIGLTNFVSRLVDTAKKTSQASIALQNVSGNMKAYAENQQWLIGLSKKYGVEVNSLTLGFAKFKAAADISSMSLEDQRKIFESVSRATVAFGLSQEDQRGVFMALSQMMSKNKVMAEELRLQLAERMPVAIQAMAKAAGVTVNELDALMKQGKVLSSEVLPKFADALTEMTPNVNLDNLNKSLVDLSNIFTDLTRKLDVEGKFKSMVDAVAGALRWLVDNTKTAISAIEHLVVVGVARFINSGVALIVRNAQRANNAAVKTVEAFERAKARLSGAEEKYGKDSKQYTKALNSYERAQSKITTEVRLRNLAAYHKGWKSVMFSIRAGVASISASFKALLASNVITLVVAGIAEAARAIYNIVASTRELKKGIENLGKVEISQEAKNLKALQQQLSSTDKNVQQGALSQINSLLGTRLTLEGDINTAIADRIALLEAEAKLQQAQELKKLAAEQGQSWWSKTINVMSAQGRPVWQWLASRNNNTLGEAAQKADALEKEARDIIARLTAKTSTTSSTATSIGGAGTAKIPVISLTIDEQEVEATLDELAKNTAKIKPTSQIYPDLQPYIDSLTSAKRDTSGDWKLSPTEILEADRIFEQDRLAKLLELSELVGNDMGAAISEALANSTDLAKAIKTAELQEALKEVQQELVSAKMGMFEGVADGVEGVLSSVERLNEALKGNADGWEVVQAMMGVFSSVAQGVATTMEALGALQEAQANARKTQAASNIAASQGEAMAEGTASAAKLPFPANVAAIATIVGSLLSVFAMIPKFAKGGIVGGTSTQGDKVLARLNSGEGVLTAVGMQSLHDASNPANSRNIRVTGVLVGQGRTLKAIIDKEDKYQRLTK